MSGVCQTYQNKASARSRAFFSTPKFDTKKPVQQVHPHEKPTSPSPSTPFKMSDAPAAPVTENGVPPAAQESVVEETPGFKVTSTSISDVARAAHPQRPPQVFAGNLAYTTTDEGLKAFFAPVQDEM